MLQKIRRVITGHNPQGQSVIISDSASPHSLTLLDSPAFGLTDLWITHTIPVNNSDNNSDATKRAVKLTPPSGGSIFRVVEFPPEKQIAGKVDRKAAFAALSASDTIDSHNAAHPLMHKTNTIDYAIVISGQIYAVLEAGETLLHTGDCLVQRGTNHAWSNRSEKPCLVAFVLIDAKPV